MNLSKPLLAKTITALLGLCGTAAAVDVEAIRPKRVVDLQEVIKKRYPRSDFSLVDIAQANGRWAALLDSGAKDAVVVKGDLNSEGAWLKCGAFDAITMDTEHHIFLRHESQWGSKATRVTIANWEISEFSIQEIPFGEAQPYLAGKKVAWKTRTGNLVSFVPGSAGLRWTQPSASFQMPLATESNHEDVFTLGLTDGGRVELGRTSETMKIFDSDGSFRRAVIPELDAAYAALNRPYPKSTLPWGRNRVLWATSSSEGSLYVCLSGVSVTEGVPIAVIRPDDGRLVKVIRALLPTAIWRQTRSNSDGIIFPSHGVADDRLVMTDSSLDIVALY